MVTINPGEGAIDMSMPTYTFDALKTFMNRQIIQVSIEKNSHLVFHGRFIFNDDDSISIGRLTQIDVQFSNHQTFQVRDIGQIDLSTLSKALNHGDSVAAQSIIFSKADSISGSSRGDTLFGYDGNNTIFAGSGNDKLDGGNGDDRIHGGSDMDIISGGSGDDDLYGENGRDTLEGGAGHDRLSGGLGSDRFIFSSLSDSAIGLQNADQILDFSHRQQDKIDITAIDAILGGGDDAFHLVSVFSNSAGELTIDPSQGGRSLVSGDVDGDGVADFQILVNGSLIAADFML